MTAPVRDPLPLGWQVECGAIFTNDKNGTQHACALEPQHLGKHHCALCGGEWASPHWASTLTPDQRGDLVRACVRVKHLVGETVGEAPRELWQAAHDTLRELMDFIDAHGEQS